MERITKSAVLRAIGWGLVVFVTLACIFVLERERATVTSEVIETSFGDVTILNGTAAEKGGPFVLLTHGFAGSRQMMQYIARDLARAGATAAMFDFYGHGRNDISLSPDISRIDGTTSQLVSQTRTMIAVTRDALSYGLPISLVGHSMATDIIIRTAQQVENVDRIVAISMYSDAVTPTFPQKLLMLSGAWEGRLREVALERLSQLTATPVEGVSVKSAGVERRAAAVPYTEHVAVLFADKTREEVRSWLELSGEVQPRCIGFAIVGALAGIIALSCPVFALLRRCEKRTFAPLKWGPTICAILLPVAGAMALGVLFQGQILGFAGMSGVFAFFAGYGLIGLGVLGWAGRVSDRPVSAGVLIFLCWGLGVFAVALDRYAASFVPSGPRAVLFVAMLAGCIPFALADRLLVTNAAFLTRIIARVAVLAALTVCVILAPQNWGLVFTVIPVLLLFYLVYGTMAHVLAARTGPTTAGLAQGIVLAWAIASSTPMFSG